MKSKSEETIRLTGQNIGCLGIRTFGNQKQDAGKEWLIKNSVDICCWQELGIAHHMMKHQDRIRERMKDHRWSRTRVCASNNKHESIDKLQFGGTMVMAVNSVAARVHASGADELGLGRWTWLLFEGHNGYRTRVISAYIPCKQHLNKDVTVYSQQARYFESQGQQGCPRRKIIVELTDLIRSWSRKGENVVLFFDCNENFNKNGELQRLLVGDKCGLIDPIRTKHPHTAPPHTYHRNHSYPIDSVFVSPRLRHIESGGWLRFGEGIGDHRAIFIDIPSQLLLGEPKFHIEQQQVRRLKCDNPQIVSRFNELLESQYIAHNTLQEIEEFNRTFHIPLLPHEEEQIEKFDRISTYAVKYADRRCRKLRMGQVPFSDVRQEAGAAIGLWKLVIRKKLGCNVSSKMIKEMTKSLDIDKPMQKSLKECTQLRNEAYKNTTLSRKMQQRIEKKFKINFMMNMKKKEILKCAKPSKRIK